MHIRCDKACLAMRDFTVPDPILTRVLQGPNAPNDPDSQLKSVWWTDPRHDLRRGLRRQFDWMLVPSSLTCPRCRQTTDCRLCPHCHAQLPDSILTQESGHIALFGPQSSGKSTFVTVLIHEMEERIGPELGFVLDPLNDEIRHRYRFEYHSKIYPDEELEGNDPEFALHYGHQPTPPSRDNREILRPLIYRLTTDEAHGSKAALLSFFDCAGEDLESEDESIREHFQGEAKYIRLAKGMVLLVDPLRLRPVALDPRLNAFPRKEFKSADYLTILRRLADFFEKPCKTPLAICLSKLDRWGPLLGEETMLHEVACSVPGARPLPANLDDLLHDEVTAVLAKWVGKKFLDHLRIKFPNHRFFAFSTLGDAASGNENEPLSRPTPQLIERPILWLLSQQGINFRENQNAQPELLR